MQHCLTQTTLGEYIVYFGDSTQSAANIHEGCQRSHLAIGPPKLCSSNMYFLYFVCLVWSIFLLIWEQFSIKGFFFSFNFKSAGKCLPFHIKLSYNNCVELLYFKLLLLIYYQQLITYFQEYT